MGEEEKEMNLNIDEETNIKLMRNRSSNKMINKNMNKSFDIGRNRHNNISNNMENSIQNKNQYININENFPQNDKTFQTLEQTLKELENKKIRNRKQNIRR
jgi:Ser-tRNA(Ala) deacylase AlaX